MFLRLGGGVDGSVRAPRVRSNRATRSLGPGEFVADGVSAGPAGPGTVGRLRQLRAGGPVARPTHRPRGARAAGSRRCAVGTVAPFRRRKSHRLTFSASDRPDLPSCPDAHLGGRGAASAQRGSVPTPSAETAPSSPPEHPAAGCRSGRSETRSGSTRRREPARPDGSVVVRRRGTG
jgi:hypothetical protein